MMSGATINRMNREAAATAAREELYPFSLTSQDLDALGAGDISVIRCIPNLGQLVPAGWRSLDLETERGLADHPYIYTDRFFVDKGVLSLNDAGGPSLSINEFCKLAANHLRPGDGLGLCDEGQFQIHVAAYRRDARRKKTLGVDTCDACGEACAEGDTLCYFCEQEEAEDHDK